MTQGTFDGFEGDSDYERRKERARKREADMSRKGRDIGPLPTIPPLGLMVKERCRHSLKDFLEFFLGSMFALEWSEDHLKAIATLEDTFLNGGQFAFAMPRGNGKSSLCLGATLWAMVYGHRKFIVPICATGPKAEQMLTSLKTIIETNERLLKVFPEVCYPIIALGGINNRATAQILNGQRTRITWTGKRLILPTVEGADSSGIIVHAAGLLGSVRGLAQASPDKPKDEENEEWWNNTDDIDAAFEPEPTAEGGMIRPDAAILDDPQTDESAKSPPQTQKRMDTISKAILNLAGPDKKIAVVCPCTVIVPDDLADQLLDRERNAEWRGRRTRLMETMPNEEAMKLWAKYKEVREQSLRAHEDIRDATAFYVENHAAMNAGAKAAWPARFEADHHDAVQYAMDKWAQNQESFWAEYQNEPRPADSLGIETLVAKVLLSRCDGSERGQVPIWAKWITAYSDVQQDVLPWIVVAWGENLRGRIIQYGAWPEQARNYYTLREVMPTLRQATQTPTVEAGIEAGLHELAKWMFEQHWTNENGDQFQCQWLGVDANWELSKQIVYTAAKQWPKLWPCHGRFVGGASLPMQLWKKKPGERAGHFWRSAFRDGTKVFDIDNNSWKTMVLKRLQAELSEGICWYGSEPHVHRMLCDQLSAEYAVRVSGRGRVVDEWKNRPGRDNHWWDGLVGSAVGASVVGAELIGQAKPTEVKRVRASEVQKRKRREDGGW
jgi:hypothetical protein